MRYSVRYIAMRILTGVCIVLVLSFFRSFVGHH